MAGTERRYLHDDIAMKQYSLDTENAPAAAASGDGFGGKASVSLKGEQVFAYDKSRKLGVTSSVFLILNKMIGTGSECHPWWILSEQCLTYMQYSLRRRGSSEQLEMSASASYCGLLAG